MFLVDEVKKDCEVIAPLDPHFMKRWTSADDCSSRRCLPHMSGLRINYEHTATVSLSVQRGRRSLVQLTGGELIDTRSEYSVTWM